MRFGQNAARVNAQNNADTLNTRMKIRENAQNNGNLLNSSAASIGAAAPLLQKAFDGNTAANSPSGDTTLTGESTNADLTMPDTGMMTAAHGGQVNLKGGGHVPGKAAVKGDSIKNDTVPAMLSPKGDRYLGAQLRCILMRLSLRWKFVRDTLAKSGGAKKHFYSGGVTEEPKGDDASAPPSADMPAESAQDVASDVVPQQASQRDASRANDPGALDGRQLWLGVVFRKPRG